jgi:hypothetical protein
VSSHLNMFAFYCQIFYIWIQIMKHDTEFIFRWWFDAHIYYLVIMPNYLFQSCVTIFVFACLTRLCSSQCYYSNSIKVLLQIYIFLTDLIWQLSIFLILFLCYLKKKKTVIRLNCDNIVCVFSPAVMESI